ncbi:MAG: low-specificity L-threonine aldolase [Candidatus Marinimicrobia bacterium]|nr:low-specificity L-threonine aldolase [Candidatus Neomarinimicrobiota bacterium]MDP6820819.1 low-specificity L-threonine aldolase [Candidatus Neomarinimicrobiota bacterium]
MIDLRSDTITLPTEGMMHAITNAKLGDDVLDEDPTVHELEKISCEITGKEAALFVPSGTMANLTAVLAHCERGDEVILGDQAHTFLYEAGGISSLGGIHSHQLKNQDDGTLALDDIRNAIRTENVHFPRTRLICLENTHNRCFGFPLHLDYLHSVRSIADENALKLHVDGARLFNAAVALGIAVEELCGPVDSTTFCLSKGLSAPVGSLVCGNTDFIYKVKRLRKVLGGGMRQAGILAAAGIEALETMVDQLALDHQHAKVLADGLSSVDGLHCNPEFVPTNIVYFLLERENITGQELVSVMEKNGIQFFELSPKRFRLVTHAGIEEKDVFKTIEIFRRVMDE